MKTPQEMQLEKSSLQRAVRKQRFLISRTFHPLFFHCHRNMTFFHFSMCYTNLQTVIHLTFIVYLFILH